MGDAEIEEVVETLRSGWLTTGPRTRRFEAAFAEAVGGAHAVAVNSCTAALHLAVEALGLTAGDGVLVPAHTFAATAEVVRYQGAHPILVDCHGDSLQIDLEDAASKLVDLRAGRLPLAADTPVKGIMPVHFAGAMIDPREIDAFARAHDLWVVEDAAHAFPASYQVDDGRWLRCGEDTARVSCFSFYANKTITTGEGGMAVTADEALASRMRIMALHGLSKDAWKRFGAGAGRSWNYEIVAPGYKYNLTDIASALGLRQLERAHEMRDRRAEIAARYLEAFADDAGFEVPVTDPRGRDAWHLFVIRLKLDRLTLGRDEVFDALGEGGVACSVHYRPLHLHPYYRDLGWRPEHCPVATQTFDRIVTLPLFSAQTDAEVEHVTKTVKEVIRTHGR